jgi:hypothetical protein
MADLGNLMSNELLVRLANAEDAVKTLTAENERLRAVGLVHQKANNDIMVKLTNEMMELREEIENQRRLRYKDEYEWNVLKTALQENPALAERWDDICMLLRLSQKD